MLTFVELSPEGMGQRGAGFERHEIARGLGLTLWRNPLMMIKVVRGVRRPAWAPPNLASGGANPRLLPPRSMVGQLPLEQHIGVRIPGGQPNRINNLPFLQTLKTPLS